MASTVVALRGGLQRAGRNAGAQRKPALMSNEVAICALLLVPLLCHGKVACARFVSEGWTNHPCLRLRNADHRRLGGADDRCLDGVAVTLRLGGRDPTVGGAVIVGGCVWWLGDEVMQAFGRGGD
jgi:hypothetical protein